MLLRRIVLLLSGILVAQPLCAEDQPIRIKPEQARQHAGKEVTVVFKVQAVKMAQRHKAVYLDSKQDFNDEENLGIAITEAGLEDLALNGILDPAEHFRGKVVRVVGKVAEREGRVYIDVRESKQLKLVKPETKGDASDTSGQPAGEPGDR